MSLSAYLFLVIWAHTEIVVQDLGFRISGFGVKATALVVACTPTLIFGAFLERARFVTQNPREPLSQATRMLLILGRNVQGGGVECSDPIARSEFIARYAPTLTLPETKKAACAVSGTPACSSCRLERDGEGGGSWVEAQAEDAAASVEGGGGGTCEMQASELERAQGGGGEGHCSWWSRNAGWC